MRILSLFRGEWRSPHARGADECALVHLGLFGLPRGRQETAVRKVGKNAEPIASAFQGDAHAPRVPYQSKIAMAIRPQRKRAAAGISSANTSSWPLITLPVGWLRGGEQFLNSPHVIGDSGFSQAGRRGWAASRYTSKTCSAVWYGLTSPSRFAYHFRQRAAVGCHHGRAAGYRFQGRQPETLLQRGKRNTVSGVPAMAGSHCEDLSPCQDLISGVALLYGQAHCSGLG